nr:protein-export chaperone SecB [Rickettsiella massiliensis]
MTNKPTTPPQPEFVIRQVYVKDLSLECPQPPQAVQIPTEPQINLQFAMNSNTMPEQQYELVLHVTVTAKTDEKLYF